MVLEEFLQTLQDRTKVNNDDPRLIRALNSSLDRVWQRLYVVCQDVKITFESSGTFGSETQTFDLGEEIADLGGDVYYASKTFWIKATSLDKYVPVVFMDVNDPRFLERDQMDAQVIQPVFASAVNMNEIRFAPALPSGTYWRADWIGKPPNFSLQTQCVTSIPEPLHNAILDDATAQVFDILDDTRAATWKREAENKTITAIHVIKRRQNQTNNGTGAYPRRSSGIWPQG